MGAKGNEVAKRRAGVKVKMIEKVWLSAREAKEYLDVKDSKTLDRLAREEMIEVCVINKKLVYYSKRGIDSMLERHAFFYEMD